MIECWLPRSEVSDDSQTMQSALMVLHWCEPHKVCWTLAIVANERCTQHHGCIILRFIYVVRRQLLQINCNDYCIRSKAPNWICGCRRSNGIVCLSPKIKLYFERSLYVFKNSIMPTINHRKIFLRVFWTDFMSSQQCTI